MLRFPARTVLDARDIPAANNVDSGVRRLPSIEEEY